MNTGYNELKQTLKGQVALDFPIKDNTYFKIGGMVDAFVEPIDETSLKIALKLIKDYDLPFYVIGNGSNLLFSDNGYKGVIIKIGHAFNGIEITDETIKVGAGTLLSQTAKAAADKDLTGLEFASGIPGYMGGAIAMNAGAYGGEMVNVVDSVKCMDYDGNSYIFTKEEMGFQYRSSRIFKEGLIVLSTTLKLSKGNKAEIYATMRDLNERRSSKQPLEKPSAGSTFKRPAQGYAAKLIEDTGLKGLRYRGAMISDKHCGFVVNEDHATASDVLSLMRIIRETVYNQHGVLLEPEVRIIGEDF
jgi:UDP-N-acetylmuramate dehydrogenase